MDKKSGVSERHSESGCEIGFQMRFYLEFFCFFFTDVQKRHYNFMCYSHDKLGDILLSLSMKHWKWIPMGGWHEVGILDVCFYTFSFVTAFEIKKFSRHPRDVNVVDEDDASTGLLRENCQQNMLFSYNFINYWWEGKRKSPGICLLLCRRWQKEK